MRAESTSATPQARACSRMRGASSTRRSATSFLESSRPTILRLGLRITAAATTGPQSAPRPASSIRAMRVQPSYRAARSKRDEQSRVIEAVRGEFTTRSCGNSRQNARENELWRSKRMSPGAKKRGQAICLSLADLNCLKKLCFGSCGSRSGFLARGALDACRFATEIAQVIQAGAAHAAFAYDFNRRDRRRVQRENAFHAGAET